ncbi:caspase-14-like [Carettochelys insculpta]|uniref:caspase-14-like n=1 Tax=Carettochelys insculpta TaxID=44489 RepID=UPI003EC00DF1
MAAGRILGVLSQLSQEQLATFKFHLQERDPTRFTTMDLEGAWNCPALATLLVQRCPREAEEVLREMLLQIGRYDLCEGAEAAPAAVPRTGKQQTTHRTSDTRFNERTEQSHRKLVTYDMSKKRVAFMMCVTTGRSGAEKDIEKMNKWLDKFQFRRPYGDCIDPNGKEILPAVEKFRDQINQSHDEISCCLIALMSHGKSNGLIEGKDGGTVDLNNIFALFNNKECLKLQKKPKIFIIQACRGGNVDHGVEQKDHKSEKADDTYDLRLPTTVDYYIIYSSQKDYVSLRNSEKGSRMIEAMYDVLSEDGTEWYIGDLFTQVNYKLSEQTFHVDENPVKQTIIMESTLTKSLYLAP